MSWVVAAAAGWVLLAVVTALVIGAGIRMAERKAGQASIGLGARNYAVDPMPQPTAAEQTAAHEAVPGGHPPGDRHRVPTTGGAASSRDQGRGRGRA
jgi:hypothetical protein